MNFHETAKSGVFSVTRAADVHSGRSHFTVALGAEDHRRVASAQGSGRPKKITGADTQRTFPGVLRGFKMRLESMPDHLDRMRPVTRRRCLAATQR